MRWLLLGSGQAAAAVTRWFLQIGESVVMVVISSEKSQSAIRYAERFPKIEQLSWEHFPYRLQDAAIDGVIFCTPDTEIAPTAERFVHEIEKISKFPQVAWQLSGALSSQQLNPLKRFSISVASVHPLAALTWQLPDQWVRGMYFALEGESLACEWAQILVGKAEGHTIHLAESDKVRYHAAAVLASNALVALADAVATIQPTQYGIAPFLPIMRQTLESVAKLGTHDALTGPVVRKDFATIEKHYNALQAFPILQSCYAQLSLWMAEMADADYSTNVRKIQLQRIFVDELSHDRKKRNRDGEK